MRTVVSLLGLCAITLSASSCCSMFGKIKPSGHYEEKKFTVCRYEKVTEEIVVPGDSKSGKDGMVQTIEKKVPRYYTETKKVWVRDPCIRHYCPRKDDCGTTSESTIRMATAQGPVGSPHIGLLPTMKPIAP